MRALYLGAALCAAVLPAAAQTVVTAIAMPVGGSVHVTMYDTYSDGSTKVVPATSSDWSSAGTVQIGNIDVDATGWTFTGTAPGVAQATGMDTANNIKGPVLTVTVTDPSKPPPTTPTITGLQYTSP